ncbi:hypothetical protein HUR95_08805 [Caldalkalibacillus thermarum TA2.A1]|uniref:Uncharacterized protein n=1 Tax=Caldalkalibacillus thermarum (strain TA2.A1) TaxID=986075 RepID=A0A8X8L9C5_CALTT|nr:hypothetical protein HUR95_08805 [Caldalkalibacillus thermarum TA2.A1]
MLGYSGRAVLGPDVPPGEVFSTLVTTTMPPFMGGLLLAVIIAAIVTSTNSILHLPSMIPAIIVSLSLMIIVSLLTKKTPAEQFEKLGM